MTSSNKRKEEYGFTLIEIIAVLVILGILAAVAVPKFMDMQGSAEKKVLQSAINDLRSRASVCYAKALLDGDGVYNSTSCDTFVTDLELPTDLTEIFQDFPGTWSTLGAADTTITYTNDHGETGDKCVIKLVDEDATTKTPTITTSGNGCP